MTAYAKAAMGLLMLLLGLASGWWLGAGRMEGKWNASKVAIAKAQDAAIIQRVTENQALIDKNAADNAAITKAKNEEIAAVRSSLAISLRRGAGICARPASAPEVAATGSSNAASSTGELFRDDIQRDLVAAISKAEEVAATARACQSFVKSTQ